MKDKNDSLLKLVLDYIALLGKLEPRVFISYFIATITAAANAVLLVYSPRLIIDGLRNGWSSGEFLLTIIKLATILIILKLLSEISGRRYEKDKDILQSKLQAHFSKKVLSLKYELLENPEILDLKMRAEYPLDSGLLLFILDTLKNIGINLFQLIGVGAILISFSPRIVLFISIMCLFSGFLMERNKKLQNEFQQNLLPINRRYNYYLNSLADEEFQKDFRIYGLDKVIRSNLQKYMDETIDLLRGVRDADSNLRIKNFFILSIMRFITYSYSGLRVIGVLGDSISLGLFTTVLAASEQFTTSINILLESVIALVKDVSFFKPLMEFNLLEEFKNPERERNKLKAESMKTLEFKNVSFSYPKTDRLILDDVSFTLNEGETLVLVGRNNAGKSTIVKLIAGLFEPTGGEILWNGVNIKELNLDSYLSELACVFQDFKLFPISIGENISCSLSTEDNSYPSEESLWEIIKRVGLFKSVSKLENGIDTQLNKFINEDGTEFSGGESQKLAIARAIYKDSSFAILDEPTAALDPLAESEVYGHFNELIKGKTAIFISHRMSASRFCDRILVLEEGKITGDGNHNSLLMTNELYNSLYEAQAQYYNS